MTYDASSSTFDFVATDLHFSIPVTEDAHLSVEMQQRP